MRPRRALLPFLTDVHLLVLTLAFPAAVRGQDAPPDPPPYAPPVAGSWEPVESLGMPPVWKPFLRFGYGFDFSGEGDAAGATVAAGVYQDFFNPVFGALGFGLEAYGGQRGERVDGGVQAYLESPAILFHTGLDWNPRLSSISPFLGLSFPVQRGGWPMAGSHARLDWIPGRDQSLIVGLKVPFGQPLAGRTRSRTVDVELPDPPRRVRLSAPLPPRSPAADVVAELTGTMDWVAGLHAFFWLENFFSLNPGRSVVETREALAALRADFDERTRRYPTRQGYEGEAAAYHAALDRAFGLALGIPAPSAEVAGRILADEARRITLDEVVLPYNRAVGRYKQPDVLFGLAARARARFIAWLELEENRPGALHPEWRTQVLGVLDAWLGHFEEIRGRIEDLKRDGRMHWLPLALVLRPEEHRTQAQVDALLARALGGGFQRGNEVVDIDAERFQDELLRTIRTAERYHVLWIHDFKGVNRDGRPDRVAFRQTTEGYLRALLENVRAYDDTGRLPVFLLLLDQHFFEENQSRLWLSLLERPLSRRARLPGDTLGMRETIAALQDSLRAAVADSRRLRAEVEAFGEDWVERVVKIHVNITNPSDFSFRSRRLLRRGPPLGADNMMRDHRKIVIRDVTEAEPWRGEVILAGVGVGETYAAPTWDDRGLVIRGPATLEAKSAVREVLERHRLVGDALPVPLRPGPLPEDFSRQVAAHEDRGATARVLQAHNRTGWGAKDATFLQMLLYDLAPAGTLLYVPDSLWSSYEWMAQLLSAALRGCHVWVVAPALANAPSPGFLPMSTTQELWTRMVLVQEAFGDVIQAAGGDLRVGLYSRRNHLDDVGGMLADVDSTFAANAFLREAFPLSGPAWSVVDRYRQGAPSVPAPDTTGEAGTATLPKMHRKTQFIASVELLRELARAPEVVEALETFLAAERGDGPGNGGAPAPAGVAAGSGGLAPLARALRRLRSEGRLGDEFLYLLSGSLNKNNRSLALDGEVLAVVAGEWALQGYLDFLLLSGGTAWMHSVADVEHFLPPFGGLKRFLGRWFHPIL
ncbi:MAG: hypothetical protein RQ751_07520 [Longimicrobiales bacterium]|nr:hypothetical protein [Longimicrobiales bacterium]